MKLYYSPVTCSLASHIALHEAGLSFEIIPVNLKTKTYPNGNFMEINPKGYVPVLELSNGERLTEGVAILQYIADQKKESGLMPPPQTMNYYHELEWLNYIATELHKSYGPLWHSDTGDEARDKTIQQLKTKYDFVQAHLQQHEFLVGDSFTIADAYLFTILNWNRFVKLDLSPWPALVSFLKKTGERPSVEKAVAAEKSGKQRL